MASSSGALPPIPPDVETLDAADVLRCALDSLGADRVALSASFGPEDIVILDLLTQITPRPRLFTLDTGRLPEESHALVERIREHFGIEVPVFTPEAADVEVMVAERGPNLFYRSIDDRHRCCELRKVRPLRRALATVDGWITGIRRDQTQTRARTPKIGLDLEHGLIWKIAPLADWTEAQVWAHIRMRDLPYNALHDRGYPSIGCAPCTRAVEPGEDPRAGRWWWEADGDPECGLHVPSGAAAAEVIS